MICEKHGYEGLNYEGRCLICKVEEGENALVQAFVQGAKWFSHSTFDFVGWACGDGAKAEALQRQEQGTLGKEVVG